MATPSAETPSVSSRASIDIKQDLDDKSAPWTGSPTLLEEMLDQLLWNEPFELETEVYVLSEYKSRPQQVDAEKGQAQKGSPPGGPLGGPPGGPPGGRPGGPPGLPPSHPMHPSQFPDGGLKAWMTVLGGFCCLFCSFGWIGAIGVFQDYYMMHTLNFLPPSTVAWIPSLQAFMMFFGGPIIGKFLDNYGPRYVLLVGTFLHVFGLMMTSLSTQYYQFILAQGITSAIGASCIFYPAMSASITWFLKRRALALGVVAAGSSVGGVVFPIMVDHLIRRVGFPWAMRGCAFLILALMIVANLAVRSRIPPMAKPFNIMDFVRPFKELPLILLTVGAFLFFMGMFLPMNYLIIQAVQQGMSQRLAAYLLPILNAVSLFGRIIPGYIADKIGRFNVMIVLCYFTAIIVLALWMPATSNAGIIVFAACYGFGSGTFVSMLPALIAQITPDVRQIGVRTGSVFAIISIAALTSNPVGGALYEIWGNKFTGLQIFCGITQIAGSTAILAARIALKGVKIRAKV